MTSLADTIRLLVMNQRYIVGQHAVERLDQRGILEWQVVAAMPDARAGRDRPEAEPNPVAEFEILLPDGTIAKVVWALLVPENVAKLVTVHYFDGA